MIYSDFFWFILIYSDFFWSKLIFSACSVTLWIGREKSVSAVHAVIIYWKYTISVKSSLYLLTSSSPVADNQVKTQNKSSQSLKLLKIAFPNMFQCFDGFRSRSVSQMPFRNLAVETGFPDFFWSKLIFSDLFWFILIFSDLSWS